MFNTPASDGTPQSVRAPLRGVPQDKMLKVLILDDERFDRHRLARMCSGLERPVDVTNAQTLRAFKDQLDAGAFDLILLDYLLPDGTGMDAMEAVRLSPDNLNAATIMITGQRQEHLAAEAMKMGCADYMTKDQLTANAFRRAVTNALQKSELTHQIEAQTFARSEVEKVLEHFASSFARDIKPLVSRMLRQLRDLRGKDQSDGFSAIDGTCIDIWEALVELERNTGPDMMALALSKSAASDEAQTAQDARKGRKPPSPFSKVSH